jgi:hypothetical protein
VSRATSTDAVRQTSPLFDHLVRACSAKLIGTLRPSALAVSGLPPPGYLVGR